MKLTHKQLRALLVDSSCIIVAQGYCPVEVGDISDDGDDFSAQLTGCDDEGLVWVFDMGDSCLPSVLSDGTVEIGGLSDSEPVRLTFYVPATQSDVLRLAELAQRQEGGKAFRIFKPEPERIASFGQLVFQPSTFVSGVGVASLGAGEFVYRATRPGGYSYAICCVGPAGVPMDADQIATLLELLER